MRLKRVLEEVLGLEGLIITKDERILGGMMVGY
jgi:hypothetical protein